MTTIQTAGTLLAADVGSRVLRYMLLPFGVPGRTSAGTVTASAGTITLPADPTTMFANNEHDYKQPLSKFASITETPAGLEASFDVLPTRAGDDLLAEAAAGAKPGISVEIANPVIRGGKLLAGLLSGAGHCVRPAFPTALLTASDMGDLAENLQKLADQAAAAAAAAAPAEDPPADPADQTDPPADPPADPTASPTETEEEMANRLKAGAPAGGAPILHAAGHQPAPAAVPGAALQQLTASLMGLPQAKDQGLLEAALGDITQADMFDVTTVPDYVGELYRGRGYVQRYANLVRQGTLTAMKSIGWRFKDGKTPQVFDYAGNLEPVTSTDVEMEGVSVTAARLAGGNKLDRIYTDLPDAGAMAAYLRESQDDYLKKIDVKVLQHLLDPLNSTATILPTLPAFYTGAAGWAKLLHGARVLLDEALPTYAIVGSDLWFEMGLTTQDQKLEYLSTQLGLEEGQAENFKLVGAPYSATSLNGTVTVGTADSTTLEQLPGGPVRVNAVGISTGSIDHGVYGYYKLWTPNPKYTVRVTDGV